MIAESVSFVSAPARLPPLRAGGWPAFAGAAWLAVHSSVACAVDTATADRGQLEGQLDDARERLDDAARDVAELTRKLYGEQEHDVMQFVGRPPQGAMLGINVESGDEDMNGVLVAGVSPGGPAAAAGLRTGDVITSLDGRPLTGTGAKDPASELVSRLRAMKPGAKVRVDYQRGEKRLTATVTTTNAEPAVVRMLREREVVPGVATAGPVFGHFAMPPFDAFLDAGHAFRSLELVTVTPKLGQYFGTDKGLLVVRAPASSDYRLEEGDVLLSVDGRVPSSPGHAFRILRSYQPGEQIKLQVLRNRKRIEVAATVPDEDMAVPMPAPGLRVPAPPRPPAPGVPPSADSA